MLNVTKGLATVDIHLMATQDLEMSMKRAGYCHKLGIDQYNQGAYLL